MMTKYQMFFMFNYASSDYYRTLEILSGDVTSSKDDILTTRKVIEAGKIMGIPCVDHIVIGGGNGNYCSMREAQLADFSNQIISMKAEDILRVADSKSTYEEGGTETMPENGRKEDLFVPDFVKEAAKAASVHNYLRNPAL